MELRILGIKTPRRLLGDFGERAAAGFLRRSGYRILKRNFVASGHEIDIIARKGDTLAFIEVKTRTLGAQSPKEPRPASAVTPDKQRAIMKAASYYKGHNPSECRMRFDVIEVYVSDEKRRRAVEIKHLIAAYDKSTAYAPGRRQE